MLVVNKLPKYEIRILARILECKENNVLKNAFTRERRLTFKNIVTLMLARKGRTTSMELFDFYRKAEKKCVSKQDYSKQRQKIKLNFFKQAMNETIFDFYENNKYATYKGYIVVGIDGSKTILPRVKELEEKYGLANANNSQQKCVQCNISGCYDCLNDIMLDIQVAPYASDEREIAKANIIALLEKLPNKKFLIIFDRGYPSVDMLNFLEEKNIKYIIRLQDSTYSAEKRNMKTRDETVNIKLTPDRLTGKMAEEVREKLKEKKYIKTRFVKYELSTGNIEYLSTNLSKKEVSEKEIGELYFKRWKIEICFNTLKNKLQIENISGKNDLTVMQDIYSTMIVYNIIETISFILKDEVKNSKENKYEYKLNQNILIGAFKELFIEVVITENAKKIKQLNQLFYEFVIHQKTAIINGRSNPHNFKGGSTKCKVNLKRSF